MRVVFQNREKPPTLHIQKYGIQRNYNTPLVQLLLSTAVDTTLYYLDVKRRYPRRPQADWDTESVLHLGNITRIQVLSSSLTCFQFNIISPERHHSVGVAGRACVIDATHERHQADVLHEAHW